MTIESYRCLSLILTDLHLRSSSDDFICFIFAFDSGFVVVVVDDDDDDDDGGDDAVVALFVSFFVILLCFFCFLFFLVCLFAHFWL